MAKEVDTSSGKPIGNTTRFLSTDEKAVCWLELAVEGFGPLTLSWKWTEPQGSTYREHSAVELIPRSGIYRFWDTLKVAGTPAELKLGNWTIEVYVRTEKLLHMSFQLEAPPTSYAALIKISGLERRLSTGVWVDGIKVGNIFGGESRELTFKIGTVHNVSVDKYVQGGVGVRFHCAVNSRAVVGESLQVFLYEVEYYLKVSSEYGVPRGEGWYRAGSLANFSVPALIGGQWGIRYVFKRWTGDFEGESMPGMILMDGPKHVSAIWVADYSPLYLLVLVAVGGAALAAGIILVIRRRRPVEPEAAKVLLQPVQICPSCGNRTVYVERVKRHYCTHCKKYI